MTHDESGLDEFHPDTSHNASPKVAPVLWLDVVETKPKTLDEFSEGEMALGITSLAIIDANYHYYLDRFQPFRLVLKSAGNNEILMWGESYFRRDDALHAAKLIASASTTVILREAERGDAVLRQAVVVEP